MSENQINPARRLGQLLIAIAGLVLTLGAHALETASAAPTLPALDASYGVHGMALFGGKDALFASHLPMFHAPHNQQVILQIEIHDPTALWLNRGTGLGAASLLCRACSTWHAAPGVAMALRQLSVPAWHAALGAQRCGQNRSGL
jgi:hypothetical protein